LTSPRALWIASFTNKKRRRIKKIKRESGMEQAFSDARSIRIRSAWAQTQVKKKKKKKKKKEKGYGVANLLLCTPLLTQIN
jgi:hypothetical protein